MQRKAHTENTEKDDVEEISQRICSRICNSGVIKVLDEVLREPCESEVEQTKIRKVIEAVLKALKTAKATNNHVDEIVNHVAIHFPRYSKQNLAKLVDFCVASIRSNDDIHKSWKDLLPILLGILEEEKCICYTNLEISGVEYKSLMINAICTSEWDSEILTSVTKMFGDMSLERNECDRVVRVLCYKMTQIAINEVPPFVHQALKLCSNHDCRFLFETLRKYFKFQYSRTATDNDNDSFEDIGVVSLQEVQSIEGTVLYHIYQATQLNYKCVTDFVKYLRNVYTVPEYILEPFMLSLLFLVSSMYENQVFEIIKLSITRGLQDGEKYKNSAWLRGLLPISQNVMEVLDRVIRNSDKSHHLILKALVEFAFVLMDSEQKAKPVEKEDNLCQIGSKVLQRIVKKRHETGAMILQMLVDKIVAGGSSVRRYTGCLAYMCRKFTMVVLDCQGTILILLDQLLSIPGAAAEQVLHAILPLIRISANVRDNLVLILRKALYRKGTNKRQMAVTGYLAILKCLKMRNAHLSVSESAGSSGHGISISTSSTSILTQVTLERDSQQSASLPVCGRSLCHDVLNILKRCFTHEYEVRLKLYEGLYNVVLKNAEVSEYALEILVAHFNNYFDEDENAVPPLKLDLCTDINGSQAVLQEPLAELLFVIQKVYIKIASNDSPILEKTATILGSLCRRMPRVELEHLNIDDRTNLLEAVPKSQQKYENLMLIITVYETLIAYRIEAWSSESTDSSHAIYSLFKAYKRFVDFSKRIARSKKGGRTKKEKDASNTTMKKSPRTAGGKLPTTGMNVESANKILSLLYSPSVSWSAADQAASLKAHPDFRYYILQTSVLLARDTMLLKDTTLELHKHRYAKGYTEIGALLYKNVVLKLREMINEDSQEVQLALECFKEICRLMRGPLSFQFENFITAIRDAESDKEFDTQIQGVVSVLQCHSRMCIELDKDDDTFLKKVPMILMETIEQLVRGIDFRKEKFHKILDSMRMLAQIENVETSLSLLILHLLLWIEERTCDDGETLNEICMELCAKLGTIEKSEITLTDQFKIIHECTALQAYNTANAFVKEKLNNAAWFLARLKASQMIISVYNTDEEIARENLKEKERSLCKQLPYIIQMLLILSNTAIDPGQSTDIIFKNLQQLYNLLVNLTKYFAARSSAQNPAFQSAKFIQVIRFAGKPLKSAFYNLVMHTEEKQNKNGKKQTDTHAQRNKILKETKIIPRVVYEIEQFNKEIMFLGKRTGIPLESHIKHSVTRDFRINNPQLAENLERMDVSMLDTQHSRTSEVESSRCASEEEPPLSPSKKRPKKSQA